MGAGDDGLPNLFEDVEAPTTPAQVRTEPRAAIALDVSFASAQDVVKGLNPNMGLGQLAIRTNAAIAKGTLLTVQLRVPGWSTPARLRGKVAWSRADAMGIAFTEVLPTDKQRLSDLVVAHTTVLERVRGRMSARAEEPVQAQVVGRKTALVALKDAMFSDVVTELLDANGIFAISADAGTGSRPNVIVADLATAAPLSQALVSVPVVLVNAYRDDLVTPGLRKVRAAAFVPRPASADRVVQAVRGVFGGH